VPSVFKFFRQMIPRIPAIVTGLALAASLFSATPGSKQNSTEAARLNNLGCAYMNQQLFEKALKNFQQAEELDPKLAIARLNEGVAFLNLQKIDEAKAALADAIKADQKNPNAWYNLGLLAKNTGDAQAAIDDFKRVIEIDSNDADTWYFLGASYVQARQFPQAIDAFQRALKLNPLHASAEFGLSRAYQQSGDLDHARENLKKFQYITQSKLGAPISLAYGEQGKYSSAVESPAYVIKPPAQIKVQFVDVTKEAGLVPREQDPNFGGPWEPFGQGACFLDYDDDGKIDLYLANGGESGGQSLYHNLGNGKFEAVTKKAGIYPSLHAVSCTAGDYDNDGATDLAISNGKHVILLHNEKDGTFKDLTNAAGISSDGSNLGLTFIDYDHDGDLDLFVNHSRTDHPKGHPHGYILSVSNLMWRNNGNGTFTDVTDALGVSGEDDSSAQTTAAIGTDYNNDHAIDLLVDWGSYPSLYENAREGKFRDRSDLTSAMGGQTNAIAVLDYDHDAWMDIAFVNFTALSAGGVSLWHNNRGESFSRVPLPQTNWMSAYGVAAFDYDNDGWVDLVAVGETKDGKGEIKLFRNLGPDGFKDVTADVGLDKIHLEHPRAIITGDYDNDGAVDLLITQNHGPAVLLKNEGGNQNHWLRLALKGLADNKSAIGAKVEVFSGGNRQKFEIYGSNGYLGQNSPYLTVGLGDAKVADVVRILWPTGVLQDEINLAADQQHNITEIDRRGSSCPTLFVWNGQRYEFVADMLGAGVVGHWVGPGQRDIPRPVEWIKVDRNMIREKAGRSCHPERSEGSMQSTPSCTGPSPQKAAAQDDKTLPAASNKRPTTNDQRPKSTLSFRFMEPLEEAVYLDQVRLLAVDHPVDTEVYPNEYFASDPPYPEFKVVVSRKAQPPAGAWDEHGHDVLPDLLARRYFGDFALTQFQGFARPHSLTLDLGQPYHGGPLWLLMHGEVEYFSANSMYAASQAGVQAISPYVEALVGSEHRGNWKRVVDDMGFPAGGPRTMTADLTGKLPVGTRIIRITTNLQIYWDSILIDRTPQTAQVTANSSREIPRPAPAAPPAEAGGLSKSAGLRDDAEFHLTFVPLARADLEFHGYPLKIEGTPPGNVRYIYEKASATGPYTRPAGTYTRYGDVLPLLANLDDKLVVFGSGDEVQLDFDPSKLPPLPKNWVRDYFFGANGYEKDMDFYAADGDYVAPLPFLSMGEYPYEPKKSFPLDDAHVNYLLEYNTRHMSGNEQRGYSFDYGPAAEPSRDPK
jgi:tetratricopeptide (TPR) repeat protein